MSATDQAGPAAGFPPAAAAEEEAATILQSPAAMAAAAEPGLREDQVANAVAFLSHPKVRGSAVSAKRSFLEKKGLTAAEIDEAFNRVPEAASPAAAPAAAAAPAPAAAAPATSAAPAYAANNLVTYTQPQLQGQVMQQAPMHGQPAHGALVPSGQHLQHLQQHPQQQPLKWSHVVLGLGIAGVSLYGLHQLLAPRLAAATQRLFAARREAAEAEAARAAALAAALDRLAAGQEQLQASLDGLAGALQQQAAAAGRSGGADYLPACQSPSLVARGGSSSQQQQQQQLGGGGRSGWDSGFGPEAASRAAALRGTDTADSSNHHGYFSKGARGGFGSDNTPAGGGYGAGSSASGLRDPGTLRLGGGSGGVGGGVGLPADGFEVVPRSPGFGDAASSSSAIGGGGARGYGGPVAGAGPGSSPYAQSSSSSRPGTAGQQAGAGSARPDEAPHSAAFHEVMEMVRAGITPPNVRTDIDDSPPDPSRPITAAQLQPRGKPWERPASNTSSFGGPYESIDVHLQQQQEQQQQQQQQQQWEQQQVGGFTPSSVTANPSRQQEASGLATAMEAAAVGAGEAARGYDLSHLLGPPAERAAPWRPPPPPPRSLHEQPAAAAAAEAAVPEAAAAVTPEAAPVAAAGSVGEPAVDDFVAGMAASMVQNVLASAEAEAAAA